MSPARASGAGTPAPLGARHGRGGLRARKLARLLARFPARDETALAELLPPTVTASVVLALLGVLGLPGALWLAELASTAPPPVREAALRELGRSGCSAARCRQVLRRALADARPGTRRAVVAGLAAGPVPSWMVKALIAALGDADPRVRAGAARALGRSHDPRAFAALEGVFRKGRTVAQVEAFGLLGDRRAEPLLLALLREQQGPSRARYRRAVIRALARVGSGAAVLRLAESLEHPDPGVRLAAADALARLGDGRALPGLAVCAEDYYGVVRRACRRAAREIRLRAGGGAPSPRHQGGGARASVRRRAQAARASARRRAQAAPPRVNEARRKTP